MPDFLRAFLHTHAELMTIVSISSLLMLVGSVLLVPWLVLRAPHDVFVRSGSRFAHRGPAFRLFISILRNTCGAILLISGVLMLVLPGQGLVTMAAALCLMDIPRKRELLRHIVARPSVWKGLGWIRHRAGRPPFDHP